MIFYTKLSAMKTKPHKKHYNDLKEYKKAANSMRYNEFEELYDDIEENINEKNNKHKEE